MVVSKGVCVADPPLSPSPPSSLTWCIIRCSYVLTMKIPSATPARLPDFVEPMKAKLVGSMPAGNWIYEIKFDGYRALALRGLKARTAFESGWGLDGEATVAKACFCHGATQKSGTTKRTEAARHDRIGASYSDFEHFQAALLPSVRPLRFNQELLPFTERTRSVWIRVSRKNCKTKTL